MITNVHCILLLTPVLAVFKLQVLHMNDLHSRFEEISDGGGECQTDAVACYGGFARIQTVLKASRQEKTNTLVLNAGDNFQGTPHYGVYKWKIVAALLNELNVDAMTLGNHEFDNGVKGLVPFIQNTSIPITVCNLNLTAEPLLPRDKLRKSVTANINGTRIGIIGYITPDTKNLAVINEDLITDEIPSIISEAKVLKDQNVNIIIALGHSGIEMDKKIAAEVADVDVIVGGHSHTFLYTGQPPDSDVPLDTYPVVVTQASGKRVPIVHAYAYSKYMGNISLTFDDDGYLQHFEGNPILLDKTIPQDEEMLAHVRQWSKNVDHFKKSVVGKSLVTLDGECNAKECNFGNLATDAMIYVSSKYNQNNVNLYTEPSIALLQAGGIRATLNYYRGKENITMSDLMTAFPFENTVQRTQVSGQILQEMLELSVSEMGYSANNKRFLQVSGLHVTYDSTRPPFQRVMKVFVRCSNCSIPRYYPLDRNKVYFILTTSFILYGGDGYFMLLGNHTTPVTIGNGTICDVVREYIEDVRVVYPEVSGRLRFAQDLEYSCGVRPAVISHLVFVLVILFYNLDYTNVFM